MTLCFLICFCVLCEVAVGKWDDCVRLNTLTEL